jgi:hypothetical protein
MAYNAQGSLQFSAWPQRYTDDLTCNKQPTASGDWLTTGCEYRGQYHAPPGGRSIACKNGVPYDCKCNLIQRPYSMPYEARWKQKPGCEKQGPGVWYMRPPYFMRESQPY